MDFKGKVIIVTGASSGIGASAALQFATLSGTLVLVGRNEERLKSVAKKVGDAKGIKPLIVKADLEKDAEVKKIIDETVKQFGRIDVLVNNAGAGVIAGIKDGIEHFDKMIATNLRSVYLLTNLALPHLIKTKGNIVNVSSIVSQKPIPDFMPYCVSKAGLDMFTKCVAKDLAIHRIRVNSVNPGPVESEFHNRLGLGKAETDALMKDRENMSPLGKIAPSEDVAELIVFMASDDKAGSITGSIVIIDNGFIL